MYTINWIGLQPTEAGWSPPSDTKVDQAKRICISAWGVAPVRPVQPTCNRKGSALQEKSTALGCRGLHRCRGCPSQRCPANRERRSAGGESDVGSAFAFHCIVSLASIDFERQGEQSGRPGVGEILSSV